MGSDTRRRSYQSTHNVVLSASDRAIKVNLVDFPYALAGKFAGKRFFQVEAELLLNMPFEMSQTTVFDDLNMLKAGFRTGAGGTHSSRTMMLSEISLLFEVMRPEANREDYAAAIIYDNCLSKLTASNRRLTNQRLGELYGLDISIPLFRVFRRLWDVDELGRPLLALLTSLTRDPLLAGTCPVILGTNVGKQLQRAPLRDSVQAVVGTRFKDSILDKTCRNIASSWTQAGYLHGRTFKIRQQVKCTPGAAAYAIYLAYTSGIRGAALFSSGWLSILDCDPSTARDFALEAKRLGLIDLRISDNIVEIGLERLDPTATISRS